MSAQQETWGEGGAPEEEIIAVMGWATGEMIQLIESPELQTKEEILEHLAKELTTLYVSTLKVKGVDSDLSKSVNRMFLLTFNQYPVFGKLMADTIEAMLEEQS